MTWEEFMKGVTILYAFGMAEKDEWELRIWHRALESEMSVVSYEQACIHLCRNNLKFWETDNIPAQILATYDKIKQENNTRLIAQRSQDDKERRELERKQALDSYESEEDRERCIAEFKEMNRKVFKTMR